jgi:uncharacterized protein (DUF2267 family)
MDAERFFSLVQRESGLDREAAERAARALLNTLARRLSPGEARDLSQLLADPMSTWLHPQDARALLDADEFVRRMATEEGVDEQTAREHARAVFFALSRAVTADEFHDMVSELPKEFRPLMEGAYHAPGQILTYDEWLSRVADRAGTDVETAKRASNAVLETLAERISGGEVDDLKMQVPAELRDSLELGRMRSHGMARKMSLEEFVRLVAEREGAPENIAFGHARAVLSTLRDSVTEQEFRDLAAELPREYVVELAHA